jgi:hypothetical protein
MSIKRTKQRSFRRGSGEEVETFSFNPKPADEPEKSWEEQIGGQPDEAFVPYSLKGTLTKGMFVAHPKFGKGIVVAVEDARADVLFQDGKKKLGHRLG